MECEKRCDHKRCNPSHSFKTGCFCVDGAFRDHNGKCVKHCPESTKARITATTLKKSKKVERITTDQLVPAQEAPRALPIPAQSPVQQSPAQLVSAQAPPIMPSIISEGVFQLAKEMKAPQAQSVLPQSLAQQIPAQESPQSPAQLVSAQGAPQNPVQLVSTHGVPISAGATLSAAIGLGAIPPHEANTDRFKSDPFFNQNQFLQQQ
jgi:hypothetical protein